MKKLLPVLCLLLLTLALVCSLASCEFLDSLFGEPSTTPPSTTTPPGDDEPEHVHTYGDWSIDRKAHQRTCTECGEKTERETHIPVIDIGVPATCGGAGIADGSHCKVCGYVLMERTETPPTEQHNFVATNYTRPTFYEKGFSSADKCSVCGLITNSVQELPAFSATCGDYAYTALALRQNGADLQSFYTDVYEACAAFLEDSGADAVRDENGNYQAFTVSYETYNITSEDAFTVLHAVQADCPLFYWIDNYSETDSTSLYVFTDALYADGDARKGYNNVIYNGILGISAPDGSDYEQIFFLHDLVIDTLDYAVENDGVTPETAVWAHNILGFFSNKRGVCETYAETCQLILNYWGIENIVVSGTADGVPHEWNLVNLEDYGWYWFDLTWDDQPAFVSGRIYDYFCRTDSGFGAATRVVDNSLYSLPARSSVRYNGAEPAPGDVFIRNNFTYLILGYNEVELINADTTGAVSVPAHVTHGEDLYTVVSIGFSDNNTLTPVFESGVTSVTIPSTVYNVRGNAFSTPTLTEVQVSTSNPYLFSENGNTIYLKSPCTLLCHLPYDQASELVLHEGIEVIREYAILSPYLETIVLPDTITAIEINALYGCDNLLSILYEGTRAEFRRFFIEGTLPDNVSIICTDGAL